MNEKKSEKLMTKNEIMSLIEVGLKTYTQDFRKRFNELANLYNIFVEQSSDLAEMKQNVTDLIQDCEVVFENLEKAYRSRWVEFDLESKQKLLLNTKSISYAQSDMTGITIIFGVADEIKKIRISAAKTEAQEKKVIPWTQIFNSIIASSIQEFPHYHDKYGKLEAELL